MHVCWGVFFFFCTLTDQLCIAHKYIRQRLQGDAGEEGEGRKKDRRREKDMKERQLPLYRDD